MLVIATCVCQNTATMILFLHGDSPFRLHERHRFLRDAFKKKYDGAGYNVSSIDGSAYSVDEFRKHTRSAGLFSQKRCISFTDIWKLNKEDQEQLRAELERVNEDADAILCIVAEPPPRKDNALFKQLLRIAKTEEYNQLAGPQLRVWIRQEAKKQGAVIDQQAVEELIARLGQDMWQLHHTLHALNHYNKTITAESVRLFADVASDEQIFGLTDAIGGKNLREALRLLEEQHRAGAHPQLLIAIIGRHIATLLKVKKTNGEGLKLHPYVIKKSLEQSQRWSEAQLLSLCGAVLELDEKTKTTSIDSKALLSLFAIEACQSASATQQPISTTYSASFEKRI